MSIRDVLEAIMVERKYQDERWGRDKEQSIPGHILIMEGELAEAKAAWLKDRTGSRSTPLEEILQVVTVGIRCLEKYGVRGSAIATDDVILGGTEPSPD